MVPEALSLARIGYLLGSLFFFCSTADPRPGQPPSGFCLSLSRSFNQEVSRAGLGPRYLSHGSEGRALLCVWRGPEIMGAASFSSVCDSVSPCANGGAGVGLT